MRCQTDVLEEKESAFRVFLAAAIVYKCDLGS
jgi:hypothetical protein